MSILKIGMYASQFPVGGKDPYWDKVVSLLHFDGDLVDETGRVWTPHLGAINYTTSVSGFGTGLSTVAGRRYLTSPSSAELNFGAEPFTVELLAQPAELTAANQYRGLVGRRLSKPEDVQYIFLQNQNNSGWAVTVLDEYPSGRRNLFYGKPLEIGRFYHLALSASEDTFRFFVDGVLADELPRVGSLIDRNYEMTIGRLGPSTNTGLYFNGVIDELRITKGVARYTEDFTPPTDPFPNR